MTLGESALKYSRSIASAAAAGVDAEPEAQLTVPVHDLLVALTDSEGLGRLDLLREAQLTGLRPDFAALLDGRACGWVELKAPGHSVEGEQWKGREKKQWALLAELDSLIVTDGHAVVLYNTGLKVAEATMPVVADGWDASGLVDLLRLFSSARPRTIKRVSELASRLAPLAKLLRERVLAGLQPETPVAAISAAKKAWSANVHEGVSDKDFASDLAQVVSYSLAIAALRGHADTNHDNFLSLTEARDFLRGPNGVLAAALGPALEVSGLYQSLAPEIGAIERLASVVDAGAIAASKDSRGEPWLWFYEDFLEKYDAKARKEAGVYYTPTNVVECQVRLVDQILIEELGKPLSFGDQEVVTLDPATGSGTYPLAVLDQAALVAERERGAAGPRQVAKSLAANVMAFELLPGPYAVSHLRIGQRLAEIAGTLTPPEEVRVYLTDTLEDPVAAPPMLGVWGDVAVLAEERAKAADVKRLQPVTVVMGNPPYKRRTASSGGGWVVHPSNGRSLFADITEAAQKHGVIFSAMRSIYDDYVYFWRWAIWKAFEQSPSGPAVVSFITSSSWLRGPAFVGLRELVRSVGDEVWIVDLGGEGRGAQREENIFSIQTPVAVVTIFRRGATTAEPAVVRYRRVSGAAGEKLAALTTIQAPKIDPDGWQTLTVDAGGVLLPASEDDIWDAMPAVTDLFPWQQPGVIFGRSWATAPSPSVLKARWAALLARVDAKERAEAFVTAPTGRNIHTTVTGLTRLSDLPPDAPHKPIVRLAYRSFDAQWTFQDPRVALLERPSLWASVSDKQIFISTLATTPLGSGPALTASVYVPDFHHFSGRGGKDVIPLYRDAAGQQPNVTHGLLDVLGTRLGRAVSAEDLAAYTYAVLSHPAYEQTFHEQLSRPGPRLPLTANLALFNEAVGLGEQLLWLQTGAQRFSSTTSGRGNRIPNIDGIGWETPVTALPDSRADISYDEQTRQLKIGDGRISGIRREVWEFSVSGFPVVERWIGSRTRKGVGRASNPKLATPLDLIRPQEWEDSWNDEILDLLRMLTHTLDLYPMQSDLLAKIIADELIAVEDLPSPSPSERAAPKV
ncbi:type ISP restriction/modification enzyme [Paenarthrobacter sp. NPDC089322]|uniref:type ISP restriction/modification enzyme n=1 Tax=Paenarthrobacter sp. NPDC089322 TaxID=3155065 RepID=UPI003437C39F